MATGSATPLKVLNSRIIDAVYIGAVLRENYLADVWPRGKTKQFAPVIFGLRAKPWFIFVKTSNGPLTCPEALQNERVQVFSILLWPRQELVPSCYWPMLWNITGWSNRVTIFVHWMPCVPRVFAFVDGAMNFPRRFSLAYALLPMTWMNSP